MSSSPETTERADGENGERPPNVVVVACDDLGYGDLGCHGNTIVRTPNVDELHDESLRFSRFYGCPLCAPSRASLMTGRYHYRTGVVSVHLGRAMMHPDEVTLAEALGDDGYRTGHFGKWHLGDNYPLRPEDQGFEETLAHRGGGIGQPGDVPANSYFDPVLHHNGAREQREGYCTDVFTDAAIDFVEANRDRPFFVHLATNAPHDPLQVADEYADPYRDRGLNDPTARIYGMVTNIDENVGRLVRTLDRLGLREDTILLFTSDHGPAYHGSVAERYNAGLRGHKRGVYEGGIRVPCFVRWPRALDGGRDVDRPAHFVDVLPTVLDACDASPPEATLDGESLLPHARGEASSGDDRRLFVQTQFEGDEPDLYGNCAVVTSRFKLVDGRELYDLREDPGETADVAGRHPDVVRDLRDAYEDWFEEVADAREFEPPRIVVGSPAENPSVLTRHDWRGPDRSGWTDDDVGYWLVDVADPGPYDVRLRFPKLTSPATAHLRLGDTHRERPMPALRPSHEPVETVTHTFERVRFEEGPGRLEAWLSTDDGAVGVRSLRVERLESG